MQLILFVSIIMNVFSNYINYPQENATLKKSNKYLNTTVKLWSKTYNYNRVAIVYKALIAH